MKTACEEVTPYRTRDGSIIRELMHPAVHGNFRQSLAQAEIAPGTQTLLHRHAQSEELYHILEGTGLMTLGASSFAVSAGDTVLIEPGVAHRIRNDGNATLRFLCACAPAYSHADTELLEQDAGE